MKGKDEELSVDEWKEYMDEHEGKMGCLVFLLLPLLETLRLL